MAARLLRPEAFGEYSAAISIASVLAALWPFGIIVNQLSSRFASRGQWGKLAGMLRTVHRRLLPAAAVAAFLLAGGLILLRGPLRFDSKWPLVTAAVLWLVLAASSISKASLRALLAWKSYGWLVGGEALVKLLLGTLLLVLVSDAAVAVGAWIVSGALAALAALWLVARRLPSPSPLRLHPRRMLSLVTPAVLVMAVSSSWQFIDLVVVKAGFGAEETGLYAAAHTLGRAVLVVGMTLDVLFVPLLARAGFRGAEARSVTGRLYLAYGAAALPVVAVAGIGNAWLVRLLFGPAYAEAASLALPLALAAFFTYGAAVAAQGTIALHALRAPLVWAALLAVAIPLMMAARDVHHVAWICATGSFASFLVMFAILWSRLGLRRPEAAP